MKANRRLPSKENKRTRKKLTPHWKVGDILSRRLAQAKKERERP